VSGAAPRLVVYSREDCHLCDVMVEELTAFLAPRGLSFEAWCYHTQIPDLLALARAFSDTTIILDHFGGPLGIGPYAGARGRGLPSGSGRSCRWPSARTSSLGGLVMEVNGFGFHHNARPPISLS
jgi:hypothetical protein